MNAHRLRKDDVEKFPSGCRMQLNEGSTVRGMISAADNSSVGVIGPLGQTLSKSISVIST